MKKNFVALVNKLDVNYRSVRCRLRRKTGAECQEDDPNNERCWDLRIQGVDIGVENLVVRIF